LFRPRLFSYLISSNKYLITFRIYYVAIVLFTSEFGVCIKSTQFRSLFKLVTVRHDGSVCVPGQEIQSGPTTYRLPGPTITHYEGPSADCWVSTANSVGTNDLSIVGPNHNPPHGPCADWRVLTANVVGIIYTQAQL
jgi:hypothetical protein